MIWGLILSCFFCNRVNNDGWEETGWWRESGVWWDDTGPDCAPWISVRDGDDKATDLVDFGTASAIQTVDVELTIANDGDLDLVIDEMNVDGDGFEASTLDSPIIEGQGSAVLTVSFTPVATGEHTGFLIITSNDPFDTEYVVELVGSLANGTMTTDTEELAFGETAIGCVRELGVQIGNSGPGPIDIEAVASDIEAFEVASDTLPKTLEPDEEVSVLVRYAPTDEGDHVGLITVTSSDASDKELEIAATGTAAFGEWNAEEFTANGTNRVFILGDAVAVPGTLEVRVSGVLAAGWSFDASANAVVFQEGNAPGDGALVKVTYAAVPVCD